MARLWTVYLQPTAGRVVCIRRKYRPGHPAIFSIARLTMEAASSPLQKIGRVLHLFPMSVYVCSKSRDGEDTYRGKGPALQQKALGRIAATLWLGAYCGIGGSLN